MVLSLITSAVGFLGVKGLIGAVVGSIVTVSVPAVFQFVSKQTTWFKKKAAPVVTAAEKEVASVASSAVANTVSTVVTDVVKKL